MTMDTPHNQTSPALKVLFIMAMALLCLSLSIGQAMALGLKQNAVIRGDTISVSDIFYDLPSHKDRVLGPAPRPGSDMVLNARTLLRIALSLDLAWRPAHSHEHIVLKRAATIIKEDEIKDTLAKELSTKGLPGNFEVQFDTQGNDIILPETSAGTFLVASVNYDPEDGRFEALVTAPAVENPIVTRRLSGQVQQIVSVPVLTNSMRNGTVISARDIKIMTVPAKSLHDDILLDANAMVGMTPRRMVIAGQPVRANDLQAPEIVSRGARVTMIYNEGGLALTAVGRALENGGKGDIIRVVNDNSNRTVEAKITGENLVTVNQL